MSATEWFRYSMFSNLAYVRWDTESVVSTNEIVRTVGDAERAPASIAGPLFTGPNAWTIPDFSPNDDSGFAANIFQNDNEVVLAIRGTEANLLEALPFVGETGWQDLLDADISDIGLTGFALDQTVSLVNYVMRLQCATDSLATQVELHTKTLSSGIDPGIAQPFITVPGGAGAFTVNTYYWLEEVAPASGLGILNAGSNVSVTGHSLGGHLAVMAIRLFPDLFDQAITFNAPGFDPLTSEELTDQFVNLFGEVLSISPADTFADIAVRVTAIESESSAPGDDVSGVASLFTGIPVGQEVLIHTENNSHSMDQLVDALAVHSLVSALNPTLEIGQLLHFYDGASMDAGATEETLISALAKVILGEVPVLDQVEAGLIGHGDFADRTQIHNQIVDIQNEVLSRGLVLEPIWDKTPEELADLAEVSIAYRYALLNLDPFVVLGDDSLYSGMSNGSSFFSDAHGEAYWLARAEMVLARFNLGLTDGDLDDIGGLIAVYTDLAINAEFSAVATNLDGPLHSIFVGEQGTGLTTVHGTDEAENIFGGAGADRLTGGAGSDYLDGGAGSDTLVAGYDIGANGDGAADWLEGGAGTDVFHVGNGDVVSDADRQVSRIDLAGQTVSTEYNWIEDGFFQSTGGDKTLEIIGNDALITINTGAGFATMTIVNFIVPGAVFLDGDFGIVLNIPDLEDFPAGGIDQVGTPFSDNPWSEDGDWTAVLGTNASEGIAGLGGSDYIQAGLGVDFVDAGPGNDVVTSNYPLDPDGDTFLGGTGNDAMTGGYGDDFFFGGDGRDFIQGGDGGDNLSGGEGRDAISGGGGSDIIYGGSGRDVIDGDQELVGISAVDWLQLGGGNPQAGWQSAGSGESGEDGSPGSEDRIWGDAGNDELFGGPGHDYLSGDSGIDSLHGGYGDDVLDGGSETDILRGDAGDDELHGGNGDDWLIGGYGEDVLAGGPGSDRYDFLELDGWDRIREVDDEPGARNWLLFDWEDYFGDYQVLQNGADLVIQSLQDDAGVIVEGWFTDPESVLDEVHFNDRIWNIDDLAALAAGQGTRWSDWFYGSEGDDWFLAGAGEDYGLGGGGDDALFGGDGPDLLIGDAGNDSLYGGDGPDFIDGGTGDDVIVAGGNDLPMQNDTLWGGEGSDTYVVELEAGVIVYVIETDATGNDHDAIQVLGDARLDDLVIHQISVGETLTNHLALEFSAAGSADPAGITIFNWFGSSGQGIDVIELPDGTELTAAAINARLNTPTDGRDFLSGTGATVTLSGLAGDDLLFGDGEENVLQGGAGSDQMYASGVENVLEGGNGADRLGVSHGQMPGGDSLVPVDVLLGGNGADILETGDFAETENGRISVLLDGGSGTDTLLVQGGHSLIIAGGKGFDSIAGAWSGANVVIVLNRGDAGDVISSSDAWSVTETETSVEESSHVVSFGGGITLNDISLRQDGNDLLLQTGPLEGLRFVDYFDLQGEAATWLTHIQLVSQATPLYESGSPLLTESSPIILLDFNTILNEYLQERSDPGVAWRVVDGDSVQEMQYLPDAAMGGQMAYVYGLLGDDACTHLGGQLLDALREVANTSAPAAIEILPTEPVAGVAIAQLPAWEDALFQYRLPDNYMVDPITLEGLPIIPASNLPAWLSYDPLTRELSGIPGQQDVGSTLVSFSATNRFGQETSVTFSLVVEAVSTSDGEVITGTHGRDHLVGSEGNDTISGGTGKDVLHGRAGDDNLDGGDARDAMFGGSGQDYLLGGSGSDHLWGDDGDDILIGEQGGDQISGGAGDDYVSGEQGNDRLQGGEGDDVLVADLGNDRLAGGAGSDSYEIWAGAGKVLILDVSGDDSIHFSFASSADAGFARRHDDLIIKIEGTKTKVVVSDWFAGSHAPVERIEFEDGVTLLERDVLQLFHQQAAFGTHATAFSSPPIMRMELELASMHIGLERMIDGGGQDSMQLFRP